MIDKTKYLLVQLMSECCEVAHRASKAAQFGLSEWQEGFEVNHKRLEDEIIDLLGTLQLLDEEDILRIDEQRKKSGIIAKIARIKKYMKYAGDIGELEKD